jgi:hypothetical protein
MLDRIFHALAVIGLMAPTSPAWSVRSDVDDGVLRPSCFHGEPSVIIEMPPMATGYTVVSYRLDNEKTVTVSTTPVLPDGTELRIPSGEVMLGGKYHVLLILVFPRGDPMRFMRFDVSGAPTLTCE